jgi:cobyrinic acid a,c-diamide synthase
MPFDTPMVNDIYLSAAHKSSGKTLVGIGIAAELRRRGVIVSAFKKGPDYIDAGWLRAATGRSCINLDFNTQTPDELRRSFDDANGSVRLIEGTKGLHDGVATDGSDSNAAMAALLNVPIILVIDTRGMTRGVAPLLQGMAGFDKQIRMAGVILNRIGGARHESKLRAAVERYTDIPCLGALGENPQLGVDERHLGLVTAAERASAPESIERLRQALSQAVDIDALLAASVFTEPLDGPDTRSRIASYGSDRATVDRISNKAKLRIGIVRDEAFCFYYDDDIAALRSTGAELVFLDAMRDSQVPQLDGLLIGGGFPEVHMRALARNIAFKRSLVERVAAGLPVYAECGGLMYLARSLESAGEKLPMCGVLPLDIVMTDKPVGRGYVRLAETGNAPWGHVNPLGRDLRAHEFHYSRIERTEADEPLCFAYKVTRGHGVDGAHDGIVQGNVFASYAHLRQTEACPWTARFVAWLVNIKSSAAPDRGRKLSELEAGSGSI